MSDYPEHEKLSAIKDQTQTIHDFLEWCGQQGIQLCEFDERSDGYWPARREDDLLADWAGIDLKAIEAEKRQMLDQIRAMNGI